MSRSLSFWGLITINSNDALLYAQVLIKLQHLSVAAGLWRLLYRNNHDSNLSDYQPQHTDTLDRYVIIKEDLVKKQWIPVGFFSWLESKHCRMSPINASINILHLANYLAKFVPMNSSLFFSLNQTLIFSELLFQTYLCGWKILVFYLRNYKNSLLNFIKVYLYMQSTFSPVGISKRTTMYLAMTGKTWW